MKKCCCKSSIKGFTLIELLVVVLIIGILSAIALPQYQKAVEKSRIASALPVLDALKKGMDMSVLENGYPQGNRQRHFLDCNCGEHPNVECAELAIDVNLGCENNERTDGNFLYNAGCSSTLCFANAFRGGADYEEKGNYSLSIVRYSSQDRWKYECSFFGENGQRACNTLQSQGNWQIFDER